MPLNPYQLSCRLVAVQDVETSRAGIRRQLLEIVQPRSSMPSADAVDMLSRMINAFSRDDGLPAWLPTSYVSAKGVPLGAGEP